MAQIVRKGEGLWHVATDYGWHQYGYLYYRTMCGRKISAKRHAEVIELPEEHTHLRVCPTCSRRINAYHAWVALP